MTPGKRVRGDLYAHVATLPEMAADVRAQVADAQRLAGAEATSRSNVFKVSRDGQRVSLLQYASFHEDPFPSLEKVWTVHLGNGRLRVRSYGKQSNPPILHRKELLLPEAHRDRKRFARLTSELTARDLLPNRPGLGFRRQWQQHLQRAGVRLDGHTLVEITS